MGQVKGAFQINALLLPVAGDLLLVPMSAIAEVIDGKVDGRRDEDPAWLQGWIDWRHHYIPVLSFEAVMGGARAADVGNTVIAICNGISAAAAERGFYGLALTGFPRSLRVFRESHLAPRDGYHCRPGELHALALAGEQMLIPDLDYLEKLSVAAPFSQRR
jgi:hypothetical protein